MLLKLSVNDPDNDMDALAMFVVEKLGVSDCDNVLDRVTLGLVRVT